MTKLYFRICTLFVLFIFTNLCQAQKLSTEVRKDFCQNALLNYWYGSDTFKYVMVQSARSIGATNNQEIEIKIENICNDIPLQEEFFRLVNSIGGNDDYKFTQFHSLGMTAKNAKELTDYVIEKYSVRNTNIDDKKSQPVKEEKPTYYAPYKLSKRAEFVGGQSEMVKYMQDSLNHSIIEDYVYSSGGNDLLKVSGQHEYIQLTALIMIKDDGAVLLKKIYQRVNNEVYNEIKRVIESMPKWKPALDENKNPVNSILQLPLTIGFF